jgi:hypothetical protein
VGLSHRSGQRCRAAGLGPAGAPLWEWITDANVLRPDEMALLEAACRETDLIALLQATLDAAPDLIVTGSMGQPVMHPAVLEIRQHRATMASLGAAGIMMKPREHSPAASIPSPGA